MPELLEAPALSMPAEFPRSPYTGSLVCEKNPFRNLRWISLSCVASTSIHSRLATQDGLEKEAEELQHRNHQDQAGLLLQNI